MGGIDSMAGTEPGQQAPPPASMTPAPPPSTSSCSAGPSPSSQGSETSFDCTHCGKSLRSRKNYSKHMFIHSGKTRLVFTYFYLFIISFEKSPNLYIINSSKGNVKDVFSDKHLEDETPPEHNKPFVKAVKYEIIHLCLLRLIPFYPQLYINDRL